MLLKSKAMLKIGTRYIVPGEEMEVPDELAKKLKEAGLATATAEPQEKAMMPKPSPKKSEKKKGD